MMMQKAVAAPPTRRDLSPLSCSIGYFCRMPLSPKAFALSLFGRHNSVRVPAQLQERGLLSWKLGVSQIPNAIV
jgi:hypothetical protein